MVSRRIRIAAAQYPLDRLATLADYRAKASRWIGEAAARGAAIAVLPEYGGMELAALGGDAVAADLQGSLGAAADTTAAMVETYRALARQHGLTVISPSAPERRGASFVNAAHLIAPSGRSAVIEKAIMTPFEKTWGISPGAALPVIDTPHARIGVAICYDSEFPLLVRRLVEAGAEIVLIPSCTERLTGASRIRAAALARALENGIVTVVSPTVGEALWSPAIDINTGRAGIYVPAEHGLSDTGVITEGNLNEPGWVLGEVDLDHLARVRLGGEMCNYQDWGLQPGAAGLPSAPVQDLR
jgi:predicted amidohydrolase